MVTRGRHSAASARGVKCSIELCVCSFLLLNETITITMTIFLRFLLFFFNVGWSKVNKLDHCIKGGFSLRAFAMDMGSLLC
jgi:hypothetical protein